jgi:hypothetical protein
VAHNQPAANIQLLEHSARGKSFLSNLSPFFTWKVSMREEQKAAYSATRHNQMKTATWNSFLSEGKSFQSHSRATFEG